MDKSYYAGFVIRNGNDFLVAVPYTDTLLIRWSNSPYDGALIHRRSIAKRIAERVGGEVVSFNPIDGKVGV